MRREQQDELEMCLQYARIFSSLLTMFSKFTSTRIYHRLDVQCNDSIRCRCKQNQPEQTSLFPIKPLNSCWSSLLMQLILESSASGDSDDVSDEMKLIKHDFSITYIAQHSCVIISTKISNLMTFVRTIT